MHCKYFSDKHFGQENENALIVKTVVKSFSHVHTMLISVACSLGRKQTVLSLTHSLKGQRKKSDEERATITESNS